MKNIMWVAVLCVLAGCATQPDAEPALQTIDQSRLTPPNVSVTIAGLGPCTDSPDRTLHLDSKQAVTVLVHGCFASAGRFRGLAQVLAFHGQQSVCFTYNDRDSMAASAAELSVALARLGGHLEQRRIDVIGHSQGALIARRALVARPPDGAASGQAPLRLVTVSGPFAGIAAAKTCGDPLLRTLSLGLIGPICHVITGAKWSEITYSSRFIVAPGRLGPQVRDYLKVVTDERGSCRRGGEQGCAESDAIFSLAEQRNPVVDSDPRVKIVEVKAGHVEIVGNNRIGPVKLIAILQEHGIIGPTAPEREQQLGQLLTALYGTGE
jgi:pimeloyl-ACP methyl ester carboxylesterase